MLSASEQEYISALVDSYISTIEKTKTGIMALRNQWPLTEVNTYSEYIRLGGDIQTARVIRDQLSAYNVFLQDTTLDALVNQYKDAYNLSSWYLDNATPINIDPVYRMDPEYVIRQQVSSPWSGAQFSQRIGIVTDLLAQDIQNAVTQAMISGNSSKELADRIETLFGAEDSKYATRSLLIARTELQRSANLARQAVFKQNDDVIQTWKVTRNGFALNTCEECMSIEDKTKEELADMGYDPETCLPLHPRCRHTWAPVVKSWKDLLGEEYAEMDQDDFSMTTPVKDDVSGTYKVEHFEKLSYDEWADKYLSDQERGNL